MATSVVDILVQVRDDASKQLAATNKSVGLLGVTAAAAFLDIGKQALRAGKAMIDFGLKGAILADRIGDLAFRLNVSSELFSTLAFAAERTGSQLEAMETGIRTLNRNMLVAAQGSKTMAELFTRLGVSVTDARGALRPTEEVLRDVSASLGKLTSDTEKAGIAQTVFGRSGADMLAIIIAGADGIKRYTERAAKLGVVIDADLTAKANLLRDTMLEVTSAIKGVQLTIARDLLPALQPLFANLSGLIVLFREFISEGDKLANTGRAIANSFRFIAAFAIALFVAVGKTTAGLVTLGKTFVALQQKDIPAFNKAFDDGAAAVLKIDRAARKMIDAMADAEEGSILFSEAQRTTTGTSKEMSAAFATTAALINKLRAVLAKLRVEQLNAISAVAIARADAVGEFEKTEQIKLVAALVSIAAETDARKAALVTERELIETTVADRVARNEQLALIDAELTIINDIEIKKRILASEEAARAVIASWQSVAAPVISTIQDVTEAAIRGQISTREAFKKIAASMVKTVLNFVVDLAVKELLATQGVELGKAALKAPGTFGASLLQIPLILAAGAAAKGVIAAIKMQEGGLVRGGIPGRDSVPVLLEPGELVLPRRVTEFMRKSFTEGQTEGETFQGNAFAGAGMGGVVFNIENVSDTRYIDILIDNINQRVLFGGGRLVASEVAP